VTYYHGCNGKTLLELMRPGEVKRERERARRDFFPWTDKHRISTTAIFGRRCLFDAIGVPLTWFPRLLRAGRDRLEACRMSSRGLHSEALDEGISVAGLLAGDQTRPFIKRAGIAGGRAARGAQLELPSPLRGEERLVRAGGRRPPGARRDNPAIAPLGARRVLRFWPVH
jgi:hypothetical protein